ncbi:pre-mRNA-splicing factor CWC2 [Fomes fomentarius]|nr:pre-mRNA-splicing factor CWC2 [Fomes fomentarius]
MSTTEAETQVVVAPKKVKKMKPARKQVKPGEVEKKEAPQTGKEYNIWYNKWAGGDREDSYSNKVKSQTRCHIKRDAGLTRANTTGMKYCCLFFARGCCPYGWECEYLHMLPDASTALPDTSKDCFARDKFADYRDDMGGVGSFQRQNRTLYIGRIKETGTGVETEEVVRRHFKEWGEIEKIRVLQYRSVAFVTYVSELDAQFAKEAMACQSLDNDEILNVRWATEDPNPTSKVAEKRRLEEIGREAIQARMDPRIVDAMHAMRALEEDVEYEAPEENERVQKRQRLIEDTSQEDVSPPPEPQPEITTGILSSDALEGLKYFAEIRRKTGLGSATAPPKATAVSAPPPASGLGLGDYASDDE